MIEIDWNKLATRGASPEDAFESFCFGVANAMLGNYGTFEYFYNTPGAEFYIELKKPFELGGVNYDSGTVIGWQAKYWVGGADIENSPLNTNHRRELIDGFSRAFRCRNSINLWIICTPGLFVQSAWDELCSSLLSIKADAKFVHWNRNIFQGFLQNDIHKYNSLFQHYFSDIYIGPDQLTSLTKKTLNFLHAKFDSDLHMSTDFEDTLQSLIDEETAEKLISAKLRDITKSVSLFKRFWTEEMWQKFTAPDGYVEKAKDYVSIIFGIVDFASQQIKDCPISIASRNVISQIQEINQQRSYLAEQLNQMHPCFENDKERHYDSILVRRLIDDVNGIQYSLWSKSERHYLSLEGLMEMRTCTHYNILAEAGQGKTHLACALAKKELEKNIPVLLLAGSKFRKATSPQEYIMGKLNCPSAMCFNDFIASIDGLGAIIKHRILIIIDGINECFPNSQIWKDELPSIYTSLESYSNVLLVVTCRDKEEYIRNYYGYNNKNEVPFSYFLNGIDDINLDSTLAKYFRKYQIQVSSICDKSVFRNPLLLKMFCECNRGKNGLVVNASSLVDAMTSYTEQMINNIASSYTFNPSSKTVKHIIKTGLNEMAKVLWEQNGRDIDYWNCFDELFKPYSEELIGEGLCFQSDIVKDSERIQFTYDMLAGYHIAQYLLSLMQEEQDVIKFFANGDNLNLIFGVEDKVHTLSEDIRNSIIVLSQRKFNKPLCAIIDNDEVLFKSIDSFDYLCATSEGRIEFERKLKHISIDDITAERICDVIVDRIKQVRSLNYLETYISYLARLNQKQLNLFLFSRIVDYSILQNIYECLCNGLSSQSYSSYSTYIMAYVLCGVVDVEYRNRFIEAIVQRTKIGDTQIISGAKTTLGICDPSIREAVYISLVGMAVKNGSAYLVKSAEELLVADLKANPTTNITLIDCLDLLIDYGQYHYGLACGKEFLTEGKSNVWNKTKYVWPACSRIFTYEFEKYKIRPISSNTYHSKSPFSEEDIKEMLLWKLRSDGYEDNDYCTINDELAKKVAYRHNCRISFDMKYGDKAYKELVGWLILNGYVLPDHKASFRISDVTIDPSFPKYTNNIRLVCTSLLPRDNDHVGEWMGIDPIDALNQKLLISLPNAKDDMMLLDGWFTQKSEYSKTEVYAHVKSTFESLSKEDLVRYEVPRYDHIFAAEVGWRDIQEKGFDDYYESPDKGLYYESHFTAWSYDRFQIPSYFFLDKRISDLLNLSFNINDLCYYDSSGSLATISMYEEQSHFFYIRKDLLKEVLNYYGCPLNYSCFATKTNMKDGVDYSDRDNCYKEFNSFRCINKDFKFLQTNIARTV